MGMYLLECSEQDAHAVWNSWIASRPALTKLVTSHTNVTSVSSGNEKRVLLSVQFKPKAGMRVFATIAIIIGLALAEIITLTFPPQTISLAFFTLGLWAITGFSPLIVLRFLRFYLLVHETALY